MNFLPIDRRLFEPPLWKLKRDELTTSFLRMTISAQDPLLSHHWQNQKKRYLCEDKFWWNAFAQDFSSDPDESTSPESVSQTALDRPWNVIVWNDPITLMDYVVYVFRKLFGYSEERATQLMLEVHHRGRSIVTTVDREKAEYYVSRLHGFGLQASLEQTED